MSLKSEILKVGDVVSLFDLTINNVARVVNVECVNLLTRKRLFEMGITKGVVVEIKKHAPLGEPVVVKIRGVELCLRKSELKNILVKVVK